MSPHGLSAVETISSPQVADGVPRDLLIRALAATSEISLITDAEQNILHASRSFTAITGYAEADVLGNNCRILQGPGTAPESAEAIRDALARGEKFQGEILNYRKDGSPFWNALKITPLCDDSGRVTHFVSVQRDISARMALHEQLRFQATHDALTGLPNRAALDDHLSRVLEPRPGTYANLAVGLVDLDGFKEVNNQLGHEAGDLILKSWAARMQARLRPGEFLARIAGDEFVLVVEDDPASQTESHPEAQTEAKLAAVLERLGGCLDSPFEAAGAAISMAMSAGVVLCPRDGTTLQGLLRRADAPLRKAKSRGPGERCWWELAGAVLPEAGPAGASPVPGPGADPAGAESAAPRNAGGGSDADVAAQYRDRLFGGGLEMFMQPAVDLLNGGIYLFEALARLKLDDGSHLPPAAFLPHLGAAETDQLFRHGLNQVLAQLAAWDSEQLSTKVSVNIAPLSLLAPDCPRFVEQTLQRHGIVPQRLVLELLETETADWDLLKAPLNRLVEMGVGVAMDDLGAGYSSLKRLSMLPFTTVKIDRDMLTGLRTSPLETLSLIATLVQIGRDFGMTVVAEGLEDLGMTEAVAVLGAQYGQGYHLARPMPATEVPAWVKDFAARDTARHLQTGLGALAFHGKFVRLGSPHPHAVRDCPLTGYLDARGAVGGDVGRWHEQQHRAERSSGASQMIIDWLVRDIRTGGDCG